MTTVRNPIRSFLQTLVIRKEYPFDDVDLFFLLLSLEQSLASGAGAGRRWPIDYDFRNSEAWWPSSTLRGLITLFHYVLSFYIHSSNNLQRLEASLLAP
jgi:hypothetical protein